MIRISGKYWISNDSWTVGERGMMNRPECKRPGVHSITNHKLFSRIGVNLHRPVVVCHKVTTNSIRLRTKVNQVGEEQHITRVTCKVMHRTHLFYVITVAKKVITAETVISLNSLGKQLPTIDAGDITRCNECQVKHGHT